MARAKPTESQAAAIVWLAERNRDGVFDKNGVLLAGGESAPFMRSTWNWLRDEGYVAFQVFPGHATRVRLSPDISVAGGIIKIGL